jgi:glycosyltransferase involved in cell wall biosynthesis
VFTTSANGDDELPESTSDEGSFEGVTVRYFRRSFPRRYFGASQLKDAVRRTIPLVDLVHLHGLWNFPVWAAALECMRLGVPFVLSPRGMLDRGSLAHHRWRKELCYSLWEKRYLRNAALLHATSESEARSLAELALGPEIVSIPNGLWVPPDVPRASVRARLGLEGEAPLVLYLGRLHPSKRLDLLLEATSLARREEPGIRLVIAGARDGVDLDVLLGEGRGWCHWVAEVDDATRWSLLSEATALVLCSDSESFGMSVLESLAVGTPVVVTRTCPWGIVEERRCGHWVDQRAEDISQAILGILRDPVEARSMGERGRMLAIERYSWRAIGREMLGHYRRTLNAN